MSLILSVVTEFSTCKSVVADHNATCKPHESKPAAQYEIKSICVEFTGDKNMKNNSLSSQSEKQRKKLTTTKTFFLTKSVKAVFLSHTLIWYAVFWKGYRLCFICDLVFSRQTGLTFSLYIYIKAQQRCTNCFLPSLWGWWRFICAAFRPLSNAKRCADVCKPITDWLTLWSMCQRAGSSRSHRKRGNFSSLLTQIYSSFVCFLIT